MDALSRTQQSIQEDEYSGIVRDFTHLAQDFSQSLNHALLIKSDFITSEFLPVWIKEPNPVRDTRGSDPGDSLARLDPKWYKSNSTTKLVESWCTAYLLRLEVFAHRWTHFDMLATRLRELAEFIDQWKIHPCIHEHFESLSLGPLEREAIDGVKWKCHKAIQTLLANLPKTVNRPTTFAALWGEEQAQEVRKALKALKLNHATVGKTKTRLVAAMAAACEHFNRWPSRYKDWPIMMNAFFPAVVWGEDIKPYEGTGIPEWYTTTYDDMLRQLQQNGRS